MADLGSLAEGIVDLHGEHKKGRCWKGSQPAHDTCTHCGHEYPCPTLCLVIDALGGERPEPTVTACVWFNEETGRVLDPGGPMLGLTYVACDLDAGHEGPHEGRSFPRMSES